MDTVASLRPLLAVSLPALAVLFVLASRGRPNVREGWTFLAAIGTFLAVASMVPGALAETVYVTDLGTYASGLEFALRADPLGVLFGSLASFLWIVTSSYSVGYMRGLDEHDQTRYFAAFAASIATAMGVAFAANLLTLFVFYELLSVATYPLVAHDESEEAIWAGRKYLIYTFGGGVAILAGTIIVLSLTGTTAFTPGGIEGLATIDPTLARVAFALLAAGFGVKAALMPFHSWLPDAMVAPTPVSALLHAVAVVKSGVFAIARVVLDVFGPEAVADLGVGVPLAAVAAVTLITASIIALRQDHLKRRLAYSTVSQLSYIVLGLGLFHEYALVGALLHIPAHAFMKITLFFCAGAVHVETHTDYISEMAGIGRRMPLTMGAFAVAAAGMAGMPLLAGFVSKWFLVVGSVSIDAYAFAAVLLLSGILNVGYYWPVVSQAFFEADDPDPKPLLNHPAGGSPGRDRTGRGITTPVPNGGTAAADLEASGDDGAHGADHDHERTAGHAPHDAGGARASVSSNWEHRSPRTESTWFMLGPIVVAAVGAIALGLVPDRLVFLDLIAIVVENAMGVSL